MKTLFAQLQLLAAKVDRRYIQLAYFVFIVASFIIRKAPSDGGSGTL